MKMTLKEIAAALEGNGERIDDILRQVNSSALRARRLAEMLRSLWPSSPLYACLLQAGDDAHLCVLNKNGQPRSAWVEPLASLLNERIDLGKGKAPPVLPSVKLPQALKLPGYSLTSARIFFGARLWGALALAVSKNASADMRAAARGLLAVYGEQLAAHLDAEAQERNRQALQKELEGQSWLAGAGELAGSLAHEFNNFLNTVLLHVALLEAESPATLRTDVTELRRQAATMTSLVKQFQQYRRRHQTGPQRLDVNQVVLDTARALAGSPSEPDQGLVIKLPPSSKIESAGQGRPAAVPLDLVLAPDPPAVLGSVADLRRLVTFLLVNAAAAAGPAGGRVMIRTDASDHQVLLRVEDAGPSVSPELLTQLFEPSTEGRAGTNSLELAACETLVRRLQGKIRCEDRAEGGLVVLVELPKAPAQSTGS